MKVICKTNLDLDRQDKWPDELPARPMVGDLIRSAHTYDDGCYLELQVVRVTWRADQSSLFTICEVELHLPTRRYETLRDFYQWYGRITGRGVHTFI